MRTSAFFEATKFWVLLALAAGPQHGYAIREQIVGDTLGVYVRDSTLYAVLKRLVAEGLVIPVGVGGYRQDYAVTEAGRRRVEAEARMWRRGGQLAQQLLGKRI